jgi:hypothetical protein
MTTCSPLLFLRQCAGSNAVVRGEAPPLHIVESNTEAPPVGPLDLAVAEVLDSTLKSK